MLINIFVHAITQFWILCLFTQTDRGEAGFLWKEYFINIKLSQGDKKIDGGISYSTKNTHVQHFWLHESELVVVWENAFAKSWGVRFCLNGIMADCGVFWGELESLSQEKEKRIETFLTPPN